MSNVLIVGNGYVGGELFAKVDKTKHKYQIHSRDTLDYHNASELNKFIFNNNIDYIINCSGFTGKPNVDEGELKKEDCWNLNVVVPLRISGVCKRLGINYIHISSGCVYGGYEKEWTEEDKPNFGLFDVSSTYSKSKHAFETLNDYGCTIRVRMPFCNSFNPRSYLTKIFKYNNLINFKNSKTYIPDLCSFVEHLIISKAKLSEVGIINFVNPNAFDTRQFTDRMIANGFENKEWQFIDYSELKIIAPRSNCVLSIEKLNRLFPDFIIQSESSALDLALSNIKLD